MSHAPWTLFWPLEGIDTCGSLAHISRQHGQIGQGFHVVHSVGMLSDAHGIQDRGPFRRGVRLGYLNDVLGRDPANFGGFFRSIALEQFSRASRNLRFVPRCNSCHGGFSTRMTFMMPLRRATSEPRFLSDVNVRYMMPGEFSEDPRRLPWRPWLWPDKLCKRPDGWATVVLDPIMKMQSESSISGIEFVMAPLPKAAARPATVEECQRRAQWSMLLVPNPTRQNFWKR